MLFLLSVFIKQSSRERQEILQSNFFNSFFNSLVGNSDLKEQIINNFSEDQIRVSWQDDLSYFKKIREKYLLYD